MAAAFDTLVKIHCSFLRLHSVKQLKAEHFVQKVYQLEIARLQEKRCYSGSEMERIQAFPVGHIDFKLRKMYIEVLQGGLYELRTPRKKIEITPAIGS